MGSVRFGIAWNGTLGPVLAVSEAHGRARRGLSRMRGACQGSFGIDGLGLAWKVLARQSGLGRLGRSRQGMAVKARHGADRRGCDWSGWAVMDCQGRALLVTAWRGRAGQSWNRWVSHGRAGLVEARTGKAALEWQCVLTDCTGAAGSTVCHGLCRAPVDQKPETWMDLVRQGVECSGSRGTARHGVHWRREAWRGSRDMARQGLRGMGRKGSHGGVRQGEGRLRHGALLRAITRHCAPLCANTQRRVDPSDNYAWKFERQGY